MNWRSSLFLAVRLVEQVFVAEVISFSSEACFVVHHLEHRGGRILSHFFSSFLSLIIALMSQLWGLIIK